MSKLRDHYLELGHNPERLENYPRYLGELASAGATEIDEYIRGKNPDFNHIKELTEILGKYELNLDTFVAGHLYRPLWKAMMKNSGREIIKFQELESETNLLRSKLENITNNPKESSEKLITLLCDLSGEFMRKWVEESSPGRRMFAA